MAQVDSLLAEAGTDKSRLLTATIWLADMADFGAMNAVWEEWIGGANAPTRATGEVRLATPDYKVEVIVTAARSEEHTSELQSLMRISYAVFCLKKKRTKPQ